MSNLPTNITNLTTAIDKVLARADVNTSEGKHYLRLNKGGIWLYGKDDIEVEEGSQWAINPNSFALGYIAWAEESSRPLGEEMRPIADDPIVEADLPDVGARWEQQVGMQMVCISGEDKGEEVIFKTSSKGGREGFNTLLRDVMATLQANQGTDKVVPVVELEVESYKHQKYGTIFKPVFNIVKWTTLSSTLDDVVEEEPAAEPEPKPARRRRRKA